ncbi:MAG TPA: acyl-ACP desaturase [Bacteroidota bacterium]|nr:acyl-ACP desaturase [Bacteroidota bacterium]
MNSIPKSFASKLEVLSDLEPVVKDLIVKHESKRELWYPSDLLPADQDHAIDEQTLAELRDRARDIPDNARVAIALNILTEEGLPHFHRLIAENLGSSTFWNSWNGLWTAEEDRHGNILRDYVRDTRLLNFSVLERLQFNYIRSGFHPDWTGDPYKVFVYTTCQEKATQVSHLNTGKLTTNTEPLLDFITQKIAQDESRHYAFYMNIFKEILSRDPNAALESASSIMPSIDMPGISIVNFNDYADVVRRSGIYGPRDFMKIIENLIANWGIDVLGNLNELGRKAQEKIMMIPARLEKVAEYIESRAKAKSFRFEVVYGRVLEMA